MANVKRLIELGMPTELAKEVAAQIDAAAGGTVAAASVTYDNSTSGLTATDVQAAIDELEGLVNP